MRRDKLPNAAASVVLSGLGPLQPFRRIGVGAPIQIERGPVGWSVFSDGSIFRRGGALIMLELGKNIREGKARGEKSSRAHGNRPGIQARSARSTRVVGQGRG